MSLHCFIRSRYLGGSVGMHRFACEVSKYLQFGRRSRVREAVAPVESASRQ